LVGKAAILQWNTPTTGVVSLNQTVNYALQNVSAYQVLSLMVQTANCTARQLSLHLSQGSLPTSGSYITDVQDDIRGLTQVLIYPFPAAVDPTYYLGITPDAGLSSNCSYTITAQTSGQPPFSRALCSLMRARTHARTHAHTHTHTHARTHAHTGVSSALTDVQWGIPMSGLLTAMNWAYYSLSVTVAPLSVQINITYDPAQCPSPVSPYLCSGPFFDSTAVVVVVRCSVVQPSASVRFNLFPNPANRGTVLQPSQSSSNQVTFVTAPSQIQPGLCVPSACLSLCHSC